MDISTDQHSNDSRSSDDLIEFTNCSNGLGLKLIGGCEDEEHVDHLYGVYIRKLLPRGLASLDGRLKMSDRIVEINDENVEGKSKQIVMRNLQLAASSGKVMLRISNDESTRKQFQKLLSLYEFDRIITKSTEFVNMNIPSSDVTEVTSTDTEMLPDSSVSDTIRADDLCRTDDLSRDDDPGHELEYNSGTMIHVLKLEMALNYLGIHPSPEQQQDLRHLVSADHNGMVSYTDFVNASKKLFKKELAQCNIDSFVAQEPSNLHQALEVYDADTTTDTDFRSDSDLLEENQRLKEELLNKNKLLTNVERKLWEVNMMLKSRDEQIVNLKSKLMTTEQAQLQAQEIESDYETVIDSLQNQLTLRRQHKPPASANTDDLRKRLAVMSCELRKCQKLQNTYQVANDKLFEYVDKVRDKISKHFKKSIPLSSGTLSPVRLSHGEQIDQAKLIEEANNILITVKALFNNDVLPFGWEEAYTADGTKHYINHVTQITTWQHPITKMNYKSSQR